jgi:hypothetical protein
VSSAVITEHDLKAKAATLGAVSTSIDPDGMAVTATNTPDRVAVDDLLEAVNATRCSRARTTGATFGSVPEGEAQLPSIRLGEGRRMTWRGGPKGAQAHQTPEAVHPKVENICVFGREEPRSRHLARQHCELMTRTAISTPFLLRRGTDSNQAEQLSNEQEGFRTAPADDLGTLVVSLVRAAFLACIVHVFRGSPRPAGLRARANR